MTDLTPEELAAWREDARDHAGIDHADYCQQCRILALIEAVERLTADLAASQDVAADAIRGIDQQRARAEQADG